MSDTDAVNWWTRAKRVIRTELLADDPATPQVFTDTEPTDGSGLRILQGVTYDPGSSAYRLHSAINETTPHASLFAVHGEMNPYTRTERQIDVWHDLAVLRQAVREADVVHCHINYNLIEVADIRRKRPENGQWDGALLHHYHGSDASEIGGERPAVRMIDQFRKADDELGAIRIGARLSHLRWADDMEWLPIAVPVHRYHALRSRYQRLGRPGVDRPLRVGHSPTDRKIKGSDAFEQVVADLRAKGVKVEAVLIEGMNHGDALALKATCDAFFDAFWLGLQGSGLEAGAMGLPVIAGDAAVRDLHIGRFGLCPYLYAADDAALATTIEGLVRDAGYRAYAGATIGKYVWQHHSYEAVARRYTEILARRAPQLASRISAAYDLADQIGDRDNGQGGIHERPQGCRRYQDPAGAMRWWPISTPFAPDHRYAHAYELGAR